MLYININTQTRTNAHISACTYKGTYAYTHVQAYTIAHIHMYIYTNVFIDIETDKNLIQLKENLYAETNYNQVIK